MKHIAPAKIPAWAIKDTIKKGRRYIRAVVVDKATVYQSLSKRGWRAIKPPKKNPPLFEHC